MFNFVGNIIGNNGAKFLADIFAVIFGSIGHAIGSVFSTIFAYLYNLFSQYIWFICQFVLGAIDAMQLAFARILGLNLSEGTSTSLADIINGLKNITVSGGSTYYDHVLKIFRAVFGVSIVLMIVFTIFAMAMQEYNQ